MLPVRSSAQVDGIPLSMMAARSTQRVRAPFALGRPRSHRDSALRWAEPWGDWRASAYGRRSLRRALRPRSTPLKSALTRRHIQETLWTRPMHTPFAWRPFGSSPPDQPRSPRPSINSRRSRLAPPLMLIAVPDASGTNSTLSRWALSRRRRTYAPASSPPVFGGISYSVAQNDAPRRFLRANKAAMLVKCRHDILDEPPLRLLWRQR